MGFLQAFILWPDLLADWLNPKKQEYFKPHELRRGVDGYGNPYQVVKALNDREATKHLEGSVQAGDVSRTCVRIAKHTYQIGVKVWNVNTDYDSMSKADREAYQDFIQAEAERINEYV